MVIWQQHQSSTRYLDVDGHLRIGQDYPHPLPDREYPFAHQLRQDVNRSQRQLDRLNVVNGILLGLAAAAGALLLWLQ